MNLRSITVLLVALMLGACASSSDATSDTPTGKTNVTVFAASSLTEAFTRLGSVFEQQNPGSNVRFNFAASDTLATQITQGGPADVFAAAGAGPMATVKAASLATDSPTVFASNRVVIITPRDPATHITNARDLASPGVKLVLAAPGVPAGDYAREVLDNLGIGKKALDNVVSNEVDDKSVVSKVLLGNADAGIVYITDLTPDVAPKLHMIHIAKADNVLARYPIVALKSGSEPSAGRRFMDLVLSPTGEKILRGFGFGPP
jgi:molybdate transport system substrate-binding protein